MTHRNFNAGKRVAVLTGLGLLLIYFGLKLYRAPLETYTWTELLINYAAGFIRRGLVGRVAYYFSQFISPIFFLTLTIILCYLLQLVLYFVGTRSLPTAEWLLFTLSPTGFLFVIYNFDAYGRKDVYLVVIFMVAYLLIQKRVRLRIAFPVILALYEVGALIHEYALFYFPFILALLLITERDRPSWVKWLLSGVGTLFLIANLVWLFGLSNQYYDLPAIAESWEGLIPNYDLTPQSGALGWLGIPLKDGLQPVFDKLTWPQTFFSYLVSTALSLIPVVLLNARFRFVETSIERFRQTPLFGWLCAAFLASTMTILLFSSDWGRLIYLYGFNLFPMAVALIERLELVDSAPEAVRSGGGYLRLAFVCFLVVFAGTWMVKMYVDGGHIALQQGAIFQLLGWIESIQ